MLLPHYLPPIVGLPSDVSQVDPDALPAAPACSNNYNRVVSDGDTLEIHHSVITRWTLRDEFW